MAETGGVAVQAPTAPLPTKNFVMNPPISSSSYEADPYSKLKILQRQLEFLTLQEVHPINS